MEDAAIKVITGAQRKAYPDEYLALQRQRELPKQSKLLGLQPWLDKEGQMDALSMQNIYHRMLAFR